MSKKPEWIYHPVPEDPAGLVFEKDVDIWIWHDREQIFQLSFQIVNVHKLISATVLISVDEGYELRINNREVCRSDGRIFSWARPARKPVLDYLKPGTNTVIIRATNSYLEKPGACFKMKLMFSDGSKETIRTGPDWVTPGGDKVRVAARMGDMPWRIPSADVCPLPAVHFRKSFHLARSVKNAVLELSALGIVEARLDGKRPEAHPSLLPGWTDYRKVVPLHKIELSELAPGDHILELILASGWYAGYVGWERGKGYYGPHPAVIASLKHGNETLLFTDTTWDSGTGPWLGADLLMGEVFDARNDVLFQGNALRFESPVPELIDVEWEPVGVVSKLEPVSIVQSAGNQCIIDFGRIIAGYAEIWVSGRAGSRVRMRHSEVLDEQGALYVEHNRMARAEDVYIIKGDTNENYRPYFTYHGFRYMELTSESDNADLAILEFGAKISGLCKPDASRPGNDEPVSAKSVLDGNGFRRAGPDVVYLHTIKANQIRSSLKRTGFFNCNVPLVNSIYNAYISSAECTLVDIPTDCAQRDERLGWTGDGSILAEAHCQTFAMGSFYARWLNELFRAQKDDGSLPDIAPWVEFGSGIAGWNNAAWPDACVWVTSQLIREYGMTSYAATVLPNLRAYCGLIWDKSDNGYRPGGQYGDWLNVDAPTPVDLIGTAYHAMMNREMHFIASKLGDRDLAAFYRNRYDIIRGIFCGKFLPDHAAIDRLSQTACVLSLHFGLVPEDRLSKVRSRLVSDIIGRDTSLSTGFLGTPWLLDELSEMGRSDLAVALLEKETYPSWGFMIRNGATALWEHWDSYKPGRGFKDPVMNSFSHASLGAFAFWFYKRAGWLHHTDPGTRTFFLRPDVAPYLKHVHINRSTIIGDIDIAWHCKDDFINATVSVPDNTRAVLATSYQQILQPGLHQLSIPYPEANK